MNLRHLMIIVATGLLASGCATLPRQIPADHPIIGVWEYESDGAQWSREFTTNGSCILIGPNGKTWWVFDYRPVNRTFVYVISSQGDKLPHEILADGRLLIERGNIATKRP